jgi:hypothetical protein
LPDQVLTITPCSTIAEFRNEFLIDETLETIATDTIGTDEVKRNTREDYKMGLFLKITTSKSKVLLKEMIRNGKHSRKLTTLAKW